MEMKENLIVPKILLCHLWPIIIWKEMRAIWFKYRDIREEQFKIPLRKKLKGKFGDFC